jgi:hypothetical protein
MEEQKMVYRICETVILYAFYKNPETQLNKIIEEYCGAGFHILNSSWESATHKHNRLGNRDTQRRNMLVIKLNIYKDFHNIHSLEPCYKLARDEIYRIYGQIITDDKWEYVNWISPIGLSFPEPTITLNDEEIGEFEKFLEDKIKELKTSYGEIFMQAAKEQTEMAKSKQGIASDEVILEHANVAQGLSWAAYYMINGKFPKTH